MMSVLYCRLISAVFRLCEVEKRAIEAKLLDCLSPQIGRSTMWFLRRWAVAYLLPDENYYTQVSLYLITDVGARIYDNKLSEDFVIYKVNTVINALYI